MATGFITQQSDRSYPGASTLSVGAWIFGEKFTSPAGGAAAFTVTELGVYCDGTAGGGGTFQMAIYDTDGSGDPGGRNTAGDGGAQLFWDLDTHDPLNGDEDNAYQDRRCFGHLTLLVILLMMNLFQELLLLVRNHQSPFIQILLLMN